MAGCQAISWSKEQRHELSLARKLGRRVVWGTKQRAPSAGMEAEGWPLPKPTTTTAMSASHGPEKGEPIVFGEMGRHATAKLAAIALKKRAESKALSLKSRTANGVVTQYGFHRIKVVAKERPALARGFFAASKGKPFMPIGILRKVLFI